MLNVRQIMQSSQKKLNSLALFVALLFSFNTAIADPAVDEFYNSYARGDFENTIDLFDKAFKSSKPGLNKENMLSVIESAFPQIENPSTDKLKKALSAAMDAKVLLFVRKKIRATQKHIDLFDSHKKDSLTELHQVIKHTVNLPSEVLKYPHDKYGQLRILRMVLDHRRFKGISKPGDFFLHAMIDHSISKSAEDALERYFKATDAQHIFYKDAKDLRAKYP